MATVTRAHLIKNEAWMTDESIMEAVKNGDLQQSSILFDRYHQRLFNFLARLAMDRDVGADLTQNVFMRLLKYRHSYREGMKFQSWIFQMARNVFSDHYQAHKGKYSKHVDVANVANKASSALDDLAQNEQEEQLHRSLAMLSQEQRELLVLTRFQQMKYDEVAELMNTTVANIKVKVHRAIGKLRENYFELEKT